MKTLIADEKKIRKRMIDLNIKTINDLSIMSGVSKPTIYDYLSGRSPISSPFIRLCDSLQINPNEVLVEIEPNDEAN